MTTAQTAAMTKCSAANRLWNKGILPCCEVATGLLPTLLYRHQAQQMVRPLPHAPAPALAPSTLCNPLSPMAAQMQKAMWMMNTMKKPR